MKSRKLGASISDVEVTGVNIHGLWLFVNGSEYFLPHKDHAWFQEAKVADILNVQLLHESHLYWPALDVDLCVESLGDPERIPMKIEKGPRHAKITGDFGEALVLYWLTKYGFECATFDHTGIDIIARNPHTNELMGISVKSRCRNVGTEGEYVTVPNGNLDKAKAACRTFACVPYFAFVVDAGDRIFGFILPMTRLLDLFPKGKTGSGWRMADKDLQQYAADPKIMAFELDTKTKRWWG